MAQISLHDYLQQIETLLEENRLSEAIAHCRHILSKFPWHVDTYRLYGKALLEQQKYDDAVDIFRRVLSADPEDFISHVGLAITHKEREEIPEAIWHMERAFEMDPYNGAIQDELRGLYASRDGVRPERIHLTRGALARLYFRGHLYQQAAAELRMLLSQSEDRIDMLTLLAETLWRDDQRVDVVDVCLRILDKLPNCIKANAILAEVWLVSGRVDEAQEYLHRLRMLTRSEKAHLEPDSVVGRAFGATNGSVDLPEYTYLEELDYFPVAQEYTGEADWVKEFGVSSETDSEANWLDELSEMDVDLFAQAADSDEDMLDWLREVAVAEEEGDGAPVAGETAVSDDLAGLTDDDDDFNWFSEDSTDANSEGESLRDVPDWLDEVTSSADAEMWNTALESDEGQEGNVLPASDSIEGETPDWIRDAALENETLEGSSLLSEVDEWQTRTLDDVVFGEDEFPDWLESSAEKEEVPDWLNEGQSGDDDFSSSDDDLPDWLTKPENTAASETVFPETSLEDTVYGVSGEELPDWLIGETAETTEETGEESTFDLGSEIDLEEGFEDFGFEGDDDDLPAWLMADEESPERDDDADNDKLPDWMSADEDFEPGLDETLIGGIEGITDDSFESPDSGETADWLSESKEESDDEGLPDWLSKADDVVLGAGAALVGASILGAGTGEDDDDLEAFESEETADWLSADDDELPDWMSAGMDFEEDSESESTNEDPTEIESLDLDETADWLSAMDIESDDNDTLPDWMSGTDDFDLGPDSALISESVGEEETDFESFESDSEETADWLSDFDVADQSGEELPTWLAESPDLIVGQTDIDQEALPNWLEGDEQEGMVREELLMGNAVDPESNEPDIPEDLDEAMKWLEELAAEQGADLAELPSLHTEQTEEPVAGIEAVEAEAVEADDVPDWLKADLSEGDLSTEDDLPDWLKNEAASMGNDDWLNMSEDDDLPDLDMGLFDSDEVEFETMAELSSDDDIPDWLKAQMPEDLQQESAGDLGTESDELSWLEQIAAGQGSAIEEPPTLSWDSDEEGDALDTESGDLSWMGDLSEADAEPSMEEPVETSLADIEIESAAESIEVPDDPEEAMAWLEQLAAQQGAPLDELPTVIDEVPSFEGDETVAESFAPEIDQEAETVFDLPDESPEPISEIEVPDDPDEAMAWLEQLAAQQGAPLDELPTVIDEVPEMEVEAEETADIPEEVISEMPTFIDLPEADVEEDASADLEIPDDPDEAMAWLEQLAAQQGAPLDELPTVDVVEEMPTPVTGIEMVESESELVFEPEAEVEPEPDVDDEFEMVLAELADVEMPEDDDEALAWLEALASGGAVAAEVVSTAVPEEPEDFVEPTTYEEEPAEVLDIDISDMNDEITISEEIFENEESAVEFEYEDEEEDGSLFDTIEDETDQFIGEEDEALAELETDLDEDGLGEALPEWLRFGSIGDTNQTDLDWLDTFDGGTAELRWMEAEEEASSAVMHIPTPAVEPEPVVFEPQEEEEDEEEFFAEELAPLPQTGPLNQSELETARTALEIGDFETALDNYKSLLESAQNVPLLIAELETETAKHGTNAGLQRLLGDAYMQNGQLQKAIDTYRQALDNL